MTKKRILDTPKFKEIVKFICCIIVILSYNAGNAQPDVEITYTKSERGYTVYAENKEYCPIMVKLNFNTNNLRVVRGNNRVHTVKANRKIPITDLEVENKNFPYSFSYNYATNFGKNNTKKYDKDYEYYLPYASTESFEVVQGYNGSFSHQDKNALDFGMPLNTPIMAIRDGVIVKVIENNDIACLEKICAKFNNYILIYHTDGTFAEYTHIKKDGSTVKKGDKVKKAELIGYSGNVGWSSGPHLHLVVYLQKMEERETIKTRFLIDSGEKSEFLEEDKVYSRNYQ
ncbi:M23 family metallopeptidase [uncultured Croceitalea sp.]|uniref:M23 family metallopeptidase n=1 Tax=uncultured Croceitalea sp. TaxID=1798908 RepID=UPI00374F09B5